MKRYRIAIKSQAITPRTLYVISSSVDRFAAKMRGRVRLSNHDRWFFIQLYGWFRRPAGSHNHPSRDARALASFGLSLLLALEVALTGRAPADRTDLRGLIRRMSLENPLWGAPRIRRTAQARV